MICIENKYIEQKDFECIGEVAFHCDLNKLCIAISEAQNFDFQKLFCDYWYQIYEIWKEVRIYEMCEEECAEPENYEIKKQLICGGEFQACGRTMSHMGVMRVLVYYAYSRYILLNGFNDTPNGMVSKTNQFSLPKPLKELQTFSNHYRDMGYEAFKRTRSFICANSAVLGFSGECGECKCDAECGGTGQNMYRVKSSIITKQ